MSRRIDIELTSSRDDGSWTWRAAGAKVPKGVVAGELLPPGASVGDELKVEVEQELEGIQVISVVQGRQKSERSDVIELIGDERPFEAVTQQRARRERPPRRDDRGGRDDRGRGPGRGRERGDGRGRDERGRGGERGPRRDGETGRPQGERRQRQRPSFTPPPEVPQRPKPKRLRPGSLRRKEVLATIPEEQRSIAELALQGMAAVRQRVRESNQKLTAEGKPAMPEASVMKLAEELLPTLRVAEWLDRAEAAQRQMEHLDLRDLRSVVAAADDPIVARDEHARSVASELKAALVTKQEHELQLWLSDIEAALGVGRVIRALRLSSQPPKAGVPFPAELAQRLADAANESLTPADAPDRWAAVLEAAAFSPVRSLILPAAVPEQVSDDLRSTVTRLAPALPTVATLFGIEVPPGAHMPKPLRPTGRPKGGAKQGDTAKSREPRGPRGASAAAKPTEPEPTETATPASEPEPTETASASEPEPTEAATPATEPEPTETAATESDDEHENDAASG